MSINGAWDNYRRMQIETATPHKLVSMLYHGAIRRCNEAVAAIDTSNIEAASEALLGAQDIITELMATLDFSAGGDIAKSLYRVYDFIQQKLVQANIAKEASGLRVVVSLVEQLAEAWDEIGKPSETAVRRSVEIQG